jgi:hypothetical protein
MDNSKYVKDVMVKYHMHTLVPTDGARLPLQPRAHGLPTLHKSGQRRLSKPT